MPKTAAPGNILVSGTRFVADAVPDPFDARDFEYRPVLQPLQAEMDNRGLAGGKYVLEQEGSSCTGHALAAVVNIALATMLLRQGSRNGKNGANGGSATRRAYPRVSPYMLYYLARRYDEFEGEQDDGSSLRGALKGWFQHGVCLEPDWPALGSARDLDDGQFIEACSEQPLGAYYRVNPFRLDDMQSAINELHAIVVSAEIYDYWESTVPRKKGNELLHVIQPTPNARSLGGHAFAIVGYNEVGFLVQNSWGEQWGKKGFGTLPYDAWLDTAYDAWVVRPGVPRTPFAIERSRTAAGTGGTLLTAPGLDYSALKKHLVNLGNDGRLSSHGKFTSDVRQIDGVVRSMAETHQDWVDSGKTTRRDVVLYAHGGLVSEADGLVIAQKHLNWWMANHVYPISFAWQSGPVETLVDQVVDSVKDKMPAGGIGFDVVERWDRGIEKLARGLVRFIWNEMKENALAASEPFRNPAAVSWDLTDGMKRQMADEAAATLTVNRLAHYVSECKEKGEVVRVHLVGHSAGSIFHQGILKLLVAEGVAVESIAFLAPAIRFDEFEADVLPLLGRSVERFATFAMTDARELDDTCSVAGITGYHKSLLYLVSRALERNRERTGGEVPLLGMAKFLDPADESGGARRRAVEHAGGEIILSPALESAPPRSRADSRSHGAFDDDPRTMTSVIMRILNASKLEDVVPYQPSPDTDAVRDAETRLTAPPSGKNDTPAPRVDRVVVPRAATSRAGRTTSADVASVASPEPSRVGQMLATQGWSEVTPGSAES